MVGTGVSFIGCESRWNGGPVIGGGCVDCLHATHEDDRGGVKVNGAAMLQFVGGIYESNQPWGFVFDSPYFSTREVTVRGICTRDACSRLSCCCCARVVSLTTTRCADTEGNGNMAMTSGNFYMSRAISSLKVIDSWLAAGRCDPPNCPNGSKNYIFFNNATWGEGAQMIEENNFLYCGGSTAEHSCQNYAGVSNALSKQLTSAVIGDSAAAGTPTTADLLAVSDDAVFVVG